MKPPTPQTLKTCLAWAAMPAKTRKLGALTVLMVALCDFGASWAQEIGSAPKLSGRPQMVLKFRPESLQCVAWSPDGALLATGTSFGAIRLWDARSGAFRRLLGSGDRTLDTINALAFSADGRMLASGDDYKEIKIWNIATGELQRSFKQENSTVAHNASVYSVAWSPDGKTLASGSLDRTAALWDVKTGVRLYTLNGHQEAVTGVAWSPDGATVASVGGDMKLWDARTGAPKGELALKSIGAGASTLPVRDNEVTSAGVETNGVETAEMETAQGVAWSPDGSTVGIARHPLALWDVKSQKLRNEGRISPVPFSGAISAIAFSPDGTLIATAHGYESRDRRECDVLIWNARTLEPKQTLRGHTKIVSGLAFSPDGKGLATVSLDGALKVWSLIGNRSPVTILPLADERVRAANWIAMTEEGFYNASDSPEMKKTLKWRVGNEEVGVEAFEATFRRPDIVGRLLRPEPLAANSEIGLLLSARSAPPLAAFISPGRNAKVLGETVTVRVAVSDESEVRRLDFRVNGRPVKVAFSVGAPQVITDASREQLLGARRVPASHTTLLNYNATIPLPVGESKVLVRAIARDSSGLEGVADLSVERELKTARGAIISALRGDEARQAEKQLQGDLHVLSVGVSRYKNPAYNLAYPVIDATSFGELWPPMKDRLYQKVFTTQLSDDQATASALQAELDKLIKKTTNKDTVLIFMAGHGIQINEEDFYFATHEVDFKNPQGTALPWTALTDILARVPAKRVVLFLDACHSGSALGKTRASNERMAETLVKRAGVMVFASSRGDQASLESPAWKHGAFTKAVWEGIAEGKANLDTGAGKDGNITVAKLLVYLQARVPSLTEGQQHPACPLMQDFGEPFQLARVTSAN